MKEVKDPAQAELLGPDTQVDLHIVADGRFDVSDGAHEAFVMKEVKDPAQAELGRGTLQSLKG